VTGGESRGVACKPKIEARHHVTRRDQNKKRFPRWTSLETNQRIDCLVVHGAAKSIYGLRRVSEHTARIQMRDCFCHGGFDL
jgi:hypothetical protein